MTPLRTIGIRASHLEAPPAPPIAVRGVPIRLPDQSSSETNQMHAKRDHARYRATIPRYRSILAPSLTIPPSPLAEIAADDRAASV